MGQPKFLPPKGSQVPDPQQTEDPMEFYISFFCFKLHVANVHILVSFTFIVALTYLITMIPQASEIILWTWFPLVAFFNTLMMMCLSSLSVVGLLVNKSSYITYYVTLVIICLVGYTPYYLLGLYLFLSPDSSLSSSIQELVDRPDYYDGERVPAVIIAFYLDTAIMCVQGVLIAVYYTASRAAIYVEAVEYQKKRATPKQIV